MADTFAIVMIVICLILLGIGLFFMVYGFTHKNQDPQCSGAGQCPPQTACVNGFCEAKTCSKQSDCDSYQSCVEGFCFNNDCQTNSDCNIFPGTVCANNLCVPLDQDCKANVDCFGGTAGLFCVSGKCKQCGAASDCNTEDYRYCGTDGICYPSCANRSATTCVGTVGNICVGDTCCTTKPTQGGCSGGNLCTESGTYCVNRFCGCAKGLLGDICAQGSDCVSNTCVGSTCVPTNATCRWNFDPSRTTQESGHCPTAAAPYCANGLCGTTTLGAPCLSYNNQGIPTNSPNYYLACNIWVDPASKPPPSNPGAVQASYCINNVCQRDPGWLGDRCSGPSDCAGNGTNGVLTCLGVQGSINNICLPNV